MEISLIKQLNEQVREKDEYEKRLEEAGIESKPVEEMMRYENEEDYPMDDDMGSDEPMGDMGGEMDGSDFASDPQTVAQEIVDRFTAPEEGQASLSQMDPSSPEFADFIGDIAGSYDMHSPEEISEIIDAVRNLIRGEEGGPTPENPLQDGMTQDDEGNSYIP